MHPMKAMFQVYKHADGLWLKTGAADRCGKGQQHLECFLLNTHSVCTNLNIEQKCHGISPYDDRQLFVGKLIHVYSCNEI